MLVNKVVEVPATKRLVLDHVRCDICRATAPDEDKWPPADKSSYDVRETEIRMKEGEIYPDGGTLRTTTVHLCPQCFETKLLTWLREQGAVPHVEHKSW